MESDSSIECDSSILLIPSRVELSCPIGVYLSVVVCVSKKVELFKFLDTFVVETGIRLSVTI